jgi:hypothetical protein
LQDEIEKKAIRRRMIAADFGILNFSGKSIEQ